jgi:hypothetical protein
MSKYFVGFILLCCVYDIESSCLHKHQKGLQLGVRIAIEKTLNVKTMIFR